MLKINQLLAHLVRLAIFILHVAFEFLIILARGLGPFHFVPHLVQ